MLTNPTKSLLRSLVRSARSSELSTGASLMEHVALVLAAFHGSSQRPEGPSRDYSPDNADPAQLRARVAEDIAQEPGLSQLFQGVPFVLTDPDFTRKLVATVRDALRLDGRQDDAGEAYDYLLEQADPLEGSIPRPIATLMAALLEPLGREAIGDPVCGRGELLAATADAIRWPLHGTQRLLFDAYGSPLWPPGEARYRETIRLHGLGNDGTDARQAALRLLLRGLPPETVTLGEAPGPEAGYDAVIARIPWGSPREASAVEPPAGSARDRLELHHVRTCLRQLRPGGRAVLLVPEAMLHGASKDAIDLRRQLVEHHDVRAVLSLGVLQARQRQRFALLVVDEPGSTKQVFCYQDGSRYHRTRDDKQFPKLDLWDMWIQVALFLDLPRPAFLRQDEWERWRYADRAEAAYAEPRIARERQMEWGEHEDVLVGVDRIRSDRARHWLVDVARIRSNGFSLFPADFAPVEEGEPGERSPLELVDELLSLELGITEDLQSLRALLGSH